MPAGAPPTPVIIDCDPGVDDAIALLLALRSPALDVLAVTTVAGNAGSDTVTANAAAVLDLANARSDLPLVRGADGPLYGARVPDETIHGVGALGGVVLPSSRRPVRTHPPAELIARFAEERPGEVVLVALGPLTNVARLVTEHPAGAAALRGIVHMGGAAFVPGNITPAAEFNAFCDPEAARIVLTSGLPIRLVPLDATRRAVFPGEFSDRLAASTDPRTATAGAMLRGLTDRHEARHGVRLCYIHDATAVASVIAPEAACWQTFGVNVECSGELTRGALVVDAFGRTNWPPTVGIAVDVAPEVIEALLLHGLEEPHR
jgi:inosine-uridine nucleoside N-ribohydrolase